MLATPAFGDEIKRDVIVLSLAASADLASTRYALAQCPSCWEGNVVMSEPAAALAIKSASVVATAWGCDQLRKHGHKRGAKVLRWGVSGLWFGAAAWNINKAR